MNARHLTHLTTTCFSIFAFASLVGCEKEAPPTITPRTTAPPGAVTQYTEDRSKDLRVLRVTEGVAFGVSCRDGKGEPCSFDGSTINDTSIAIVKRAYSDNAHILSYGPRYSQTAYLQENVFVVVGKKTGTTTLNLSTTQGMFPVRIEVLAAP